MAYFRDSKVRFEKRFNIGTLFKSYGNELEKGFVASYKVSKLIAKCGKSRTIGETIIIPAVKEIISTMMPTQKDVTTSMELFSSFSNSSVSFRIDEMANDIKSKLCDELKTTQFSLQLDKTILRDNEALILGYVRFINTSHELIEEFLFAEQLKVGFNGL